MQSLDSVTFCSIGENCLPQGILDRRKLPNVVSPFSWARSNVDYAIGILNSSFETLLSEEHLKHEERYGHQLAVNRLFVAEPGLFERSVSSGFEFTHHDVLGDPVQRASYQRKIARIRALIEGDHGTVVFFYHHRSGSDSDKSRVIAKLQQFADLCNAHRSGSGGGFHVLMMSQVIVPLQTDRRIDFEVVGDVTHYTFRTLRPWAGNVHEELWAKVDDDLLDQMFTRFMGRHKVGPEGIS